MLKLLGSMNLVPRRAESSAGGGREPANVSPCWAQPPKQTGLLWGHVGVALVATACGVEAPLAYDKVPDSNGAGRDTDSREVPSGSPVGQDDGAPGIVEGRYPDAPYGTTRGATIENLRWFGWSNPEAAGFDLEAAHAVSLSDFYNPDGDPDAPEYILLNAVASWCGVCRTEYQDLRNKGIYEEFGPRGLQVFGVLFEDNNGEPSTYRDLHNWTRAYSVAFPFVNDPGFRSGVFFDKSATPMNMLIDARTMKIELVMTGYNPLIYDQIDNLLTQRGR